MALEPFDPRSRFPIEIRARIFKYSLLRVDKEQELEQYHVETCVILAALRSGCASAENPSEEYWTALGQRKKGYKRIRNAVHKTPALLIALRCAPDLYSQALEIYYNINKFELSPGWSNRSLASVDTHLSQTTLRSIKNLDVLTDGFDWDGLLMTERNDRIARPAQPVTEDDAPNFNLSRVISQLTNLQVLRVKLMVNRWEDCAIFLDMVRRLKKLTRVQFEVTAPCPNTYYSPHPDHTGDLVEGMNQIWGVQAKLLHVDEVGGVFFWQAPQGHTLNWSWSLYRKYLQSKMKEARAYGDHACHPQFRIGGPNPYSWDESGGRWFVGPKRWVHPYWYTPAHTPRTI